jgi:DNA-binding response OmpR family regulator
MQTRRAVVVENDPDVAGWSAALLRHAGYEVRVAHTPEHALDELRDRAPDVVVLDEDGRDTSGVEVLAAIRRDPRLCNTPVIVYSAGNGRSPFVGDAAPDAVVSKSDGAAGLLSAVTRVS